MKASRWVGVLAAAVVLCPALARADKVWENATNAQIAKDAADRTVEQKTADADKEYAVLKAQAAKANSPASEALSRWCVNTAQAPAWCHGVAELKTENLAKTGTSFPLAAWCKDAGAKDHCKDFNDAVSAGTDAEAVSKADGAYTALTKDMTATSPKGKAALTWCVAQTPRPDWCTVTAVPAVEEAEDADETFPLSAWCSSDTSTAAKAACTKFLELQKELTSAKEKQLAAIATLAEKQAEVVASNQSTGSLGSRLAGARKARCVTAYCWGGSTGDKFAFEPVIELPVGLTWATGNGALARHINTSGLDVRLNAGVRLWFAYDVFSVGVLLFQPTLTSSRSVDFPGVEGLGSDSIRRPYPSLAIGFAGDIFLLTASYDQLRNVNSAGGHDPEYLPNEVLSRTITFGLYLAPFTAARNGLGASGAEK